MGRTTAGVGLGYRGTWLALGLSLLGCGEDPGPEGPPFLIDIPVERFTLDNGLEVATATNQTSPVVDARIAFRCGSFVEGAELNGYSHLFEHMMFQGSNEVPDPRAYHAAIDALGATSNAITSIDQVAYFFRVVPSALEPGLKLFSHALISPVLDPVELEKEKQVVLGEFDLDESDPDFLLYRAARHGLFGDDTPRLDPLGSRSVVEQVTREQLQDMHARYYVPNNALLIFSGAISPLDARQLAEDYFGEWAPADDPFADDPPPIPATTDHNQYQVLSADVTGSSIEIWWPGPSLERNAADVTAGGLLSDITYQTDNIFRRLVSSDQIFSAGLDVSSSLEAGWIRLHVQVIAGQERAALLSVGEMLPLLSSESAFTPAQLEKARASAFRNALQLAIRPSSVASALASDWSRHRSGRVLDFLSDAYAVEQPDLRRFASQYLRASVPHVTVLMASPEVIASQHIDEAWLQKAAP